jgi:arylsulfatase A-like enzyme
VTVATTNVLLLAIDSLRADAVLGEHVGTPTLDALGRRGSLFRQCVCTCTTTTPSFASMLTGCYPPKHGVRGLQGYRLSPELTTMAEAFAAEGYHTHAEATGPLLPATGVLRGFEDQRHRPAYKVPFFGWRDEVVARMRSYVEPWFMLLHIWEVHRPYRSPPDFAKRKDRAGYEAAVTATDEWLAPVFEAAGDDALVIVTGDHGEEYPDSTFGLQMIRVARKTRRVLRTHKWNRALDEKLAGVDIGHGFALYEHLVRVPLIISGPGIEPRAIDDQVRHVDILPTVAELCGLKVPEGIDGRSIRPLMEGTSLPEEPAYMEAVGVKLGGGRVVGARVPDWKLVRSASGRTSLFKLNGGTAAPDEKRNLYRAYPEVGRRLETFIEEIDTGEGVAESGMTSDEEELVEQHLRDLGYL